MKRALYIGLGMASVLFLAQVSTSTGAAPVYLTNGSAAAGKVGTPLNPLVTASAPGGVGAFGENLSQEGMVDQYLSFAYTNNSETITSVVDGGTITNAGSHAVLSTTTSDAGFAYFESKHGSRYVPGQGMAARFTFTLSECADNAHAEVGIGNGEDGFFFACHNGDFGVLRRHSGVDTFVPQSQWNGDRFDGTGQSGHTLNTAKGYPYQITYQWLGYGQVTFFIENPNTGRFEVVHAIRYAGTASETSIHNPTLPLRAMVQNTGNATNVVLRVPSMAIIRHGPQPNGGLLFSNAKTRSVTNAASVPVFAIRNNASVFDGQVNRTRLKLIYLSNAVGGNADMTMRLVLNPTVTGATWTDTNAATSISAVNTNGAATISGGRDLFSFVSENNSSIQIDLSTMSIVLNPGDVLAIAAQSGSSTQTVRSALTWREEY